MILNVCNNPQISTGKGPNLLCAEENDLGVGTLLSLGGHKNASPSLASYCFIVVLSKYEPHPLLPPPRPLPVVLCFAEKHSWLLFSYSRTRLITQSHSALSGLNSYNSFSVLLGTYPNTQIIQTILQVHILVCQDQNAFSSKSVRIENKPRLAGASVIKMLCRKKPILFL